MNLDSGNTAPDFELFDAERKIFRLSDQRGKKVLILFFPAAFSSTCTKELCSTRDELSLYNTLNTKVIAISTDSVYVLKRYKDENDFNFPLLSDYNKEVTAQYGVAYEVFNFGMKGTSKRAAFVIDENGKIIYAEVLDNANHLPDFEKIKMALNTNMPV
jgi:peroxiredoxin